MRRRLTTVLVGLAVVGCSLPVASAATTPNAPQAAPAPVDVPDLGYAAMVPDRARSSSGHYLADGSTLTVSAVDAAGTRWRVTLTGGATAVALDLTVTPLLGGVVWGSAVRLHGGILIEPATELASPALVTATNAAGSPVTPALEADADGRRLRLAAQTPDAPGSVAVSRLGAVLDGEVPPAVLSADRSSLLAAAATVAGTPDPPALTPPDLPTGCAAAQSGVNARRELLDSLVAANVDPERSIIEQLAATAQATRTPGTADRPLAEALAGRVARRLLAALDADRAGPERGAARFDAAATSAAAAASALGLVPGRSPATPPTGAPAATRRPSPTPGIERTVTDPFAQLAAGMASWADNLGMVDAASLGADHDYGAPARITRRQRLLGPLGVLPSGATVASLVAAERFHLVLDITITSAPGDPAPLNAGTSLEADIVPLGSDIGTPVGLANGVHLRVGALLPCASPPVVLIGADHYVPAAEALDAAVRQALAAQLSAGNGLLPFPLSDGASPATDARLQGSAPLPGHAAAVAVTAHARLLHVPAGNG